MIDSFAGFTIFSFWIVFLVGIPGLFLLRLFSAWKDKLPRRTFLFVLLMPLSIGYFLTYRQSPAKTVIYEILMVVFAIFALWASGFMFFIRFF